MDTLNQPHDKYFKAIFGTVNFAGDFLSNYLPKEIVDMVDMNSLTPQKDSYLDKELKEQFSDLLFRVDINSRPGYIYFLFEHKSYKDRMVIFQVLKYMVAVWEALIRTEGKQRKEEGLKASQDMVLPIILPIIIYHGKDEWNIKRSIGEMIPDFNMLPLTLKRYIPNFEYLLFDLPKWKEQGKRIKAETQMTINTLSRARYASKDEAVQLIIDAVELINITKEKELVSYYVDISIYYMLNVRDDINNKDMENIVGKISKEGGEIVMSIAERLRQEGRQEVMSVAERLREEGRQEARQKGIEEGIQEGRQEGIEEGETQALVKTAIRLLTKRFGSLSEDNKAKIEELDNQTLENIIDGILDYESLDDINKILK